MFKKIVAVVLVIALTAAVSIAGTMAYLTSEDSDVNVMTLGNVKIEQHEYQRAENVAHNATASKKENTLVPFVQGQALYPATYKDGTAYTAEATDLFKWGDYVYSGTAANGLWNDAKLSNVMDKMVFVENTGKSDAYVRTIIAFECPEGMEYSEGSDKEFMMNVNGSKTAYSWDKTVGYITVDNTRYLVAVATYLKVLEPGNTGHPSLLQVVMTHNATNEDMELLGDTYEILTLSQAVQTQGFADAATALNTAFGDVTAEKAAEWFGGMGNPKLIVEEEVNYLTVGDTVEVSSAGGNTIYRGILSEGNAKASKIQIQEGITRLNNRALCKDMNLKEVTLPDSLTYIDEGVFQQSGFVEIEVPENVTYIGKTAFGACPDLETIVIKAKNVTFANYVARDSAALKEVYIYSDTVTFETGSMYFTNKQTGDASGITFYVSNQVVADALFNASSASRSYGMLIKSIDGTTEYYNTLK